MTKEKAVERILSDLHLPRNCEDYVYQTIGLLGCDDTLDLETVKGVEIVIQREMQR
jgi:hypothetical protein